MKRYRLDMWRNKQYISRIRKLKEQKRLRDIEYKLEILTELFLNYEP